MSCFEYVPAALDLHADVPHKKTTKQTQNNNSDKDIRTKHALNNQYQRQWMKKQTTNKNGDAPKISSNSI